MREIKFVLIGVMALMLFAGCTPKVTSTSPEDTPPIHYLKGMKDLDEGRLAEAKVHFDRAVQLDDDFAPGYAGQALYGALTVATLADGDAKEDGVDDFRSLLFKAQKKADARGVSAAVKFIVDTTAVRCETVAKGDDWLDKAERWYNKGRKLEGIQKDELAYYGDVEALPYYMAKAFYEVPEYGEAKTLLGSVMQQNPSMWDQPANDLFARIQKVERASFTYTASGVSKVIAAKESVARADVAALIVAELDLDTLFSKVDAVQPDAAFIPADMVNHPYKAQVLEIMKWNVRGLQPVYDAKTQAKLFNPDETVTRKQMALTLEDILIKVSGDETLATKFFGQDTSPYADVKPTEAYYNAVVNVVTRNLMETDMSGTFRPDDNLSGADLLLAVVRLRDAVSKK